MIDLLNLYICIFFKEVATFGLMGLNFYILSLNINQNNQLNAHLCKDSNARFTTVPLKP